MSKYNTMIADITESEAHRDGSVTLKGNVVYAIGEDFQPGDRIETTVTARTAEFLNGGQPGAYMLEKVDPQGTCGHATAAGKMELQPALIGPLSVYWKDDKSRIHSVTFDKTGLEGDALPQAEAAMKRFASTMRVNRSIISLDEEGKPLGTAIVPSSALQKGIAQVMEDNPSASALIIRDGQHAITARFKYDGAERRFEMPKLKDGSAPTFNGDRVEIVPVESRNYLTNRFAPMRSSAVTELKLMLGKSDRQLHYEALLYPSWDSFASGIAMSRPLPKGGFTMDRAAMAFPTHPARSVPGAVRCLPAEESKESTRKKLTDLLDALGVEPEIVDLVIKSAARAEMDRGQTRENAQGDDARRGIRQDTHQNEINGAMGAVEKTIKPAPAAQHHAEATSPEVPLPDPGQSPAARSATALAPEVAQKPEPIPTSRPAPRPSFGRRR